MDGSTVDPEWVEVATVAKLYVHPIKSCRGVSVESCTCCEQGVILTGTEIGDRTLMVVHEKGRFVTGRQFPKLMLVHPSLIGKDTLKLEGPGMDPLDFKIPDLNKESKVLNYKVFGDQCIGLDCGDQVAQWIQKYLNDGTMRLLFHHPKLDKNIRPQLLEFPHLNVYAKKPVRSAFQDFSPFNMLSQASVDELNLKLEKKVTERNFRPNVLLTGCSAFQEDTWRHLKIGSAEFVFCKHCTRCLMTTIDPETGVKSEDALPLERLREFRKCAPEERALYGNAPKFSCDFVNIKEGAISVGDKVYLDVCAQ